MALSIIFVLTLLLETPVGYAMLLSVAGAMLIQGQIPLEALPQQLISGVDSFPLIAIPMFILAGEVMNVGGITQRLVKLALALVGSMRGGLAQVGIVTNLFMAGISGSGLADATATGSVLLPIMKEAGYKPAFSTAVLGSAAMLGPIIPPSLLMVVYGSISGVSIGKLFLAGVVPGLVTAAILMVTTAFLAKSYSLPVAASFRFSELKSAFVHALPATVMPVVIIGGILSGAFTATEAAAVAAGYAFIASFLLRELKWSQIPGILVRTSVTTAAVCFIIAASNPLNWVLAWERVPEMIFASMAGLASSPWTLLLVINLVLFLLGLPLDGVPLIIVTAPVLLPMITKAGIDPVHFGVVLSFNVMMGSLTPPVGPTMFALCRIAGVKASDFVRAWWPYCVVLVLALLIITYLPSVVLWLPNLFMPAA